MSLVTTSQLKHFRIVKTLQFLLTPDGKRDESAQLYSSLSAHGTTLHREHGVVEEGATSDGYDSKMRTVLDDTSTGGKHHSGMHEAMVCHVKLP